ncbi:MAG: HDOD domain-containing protein [Desulfobacteraceae bacterium]
MGLIAVDQLKQGMVLAEDVVDINSRLLLKKGGAVEPRHIRMFKMWGVGEVHVQGEVAADAETGAGCDPAQFEAVARLTSERFRFNDLNHPVIKQLFTISVHHHSMCFDPTADKVPIPVSKRETPGITVSDIRDRLKRTEIKLPEIPSIVYELNDVIVDPFASADDIAQVVNKSPSLASLLLRIVNSAFYGFPGKIDRISRAVALIGSKEISSLALGISTMRLFDEIPKEIMDVRSFFKHSLACGILSRILAAHLNISQTEQLFVSGLLHDIGRAIVFKYFPQEAIAMLADARSSGKRLYDVEFDTLRCRHTQVGRDLLRKWKLPYSLENGIHAHHTPSKAQEVNRAAVVHLADLCVHALELGASGEQAVPPLDENAVQTLPLGPGVLKTAIPQTLHQLEYLESAFQECSHDD